MTAFRYERNSKSTRKFELQVHIGVFSWQNVVKYLLNYHKIFLSNISYPLELIRMVNEDFLKKISWNHNCMNMKMLLQILCQTIVWYLALYIHTRRNLKITLNVCSCSCDESNCDELSKRSFRVVVILFLKRVGVKEWAQNYTWILMKYF